MSELPPRQAVHPEGPRGWGVSPLILPLGLRGWEGTSELAGCSILETCFSPGGAETRARVGSASRGPLLRTEGPQGRTGRLCRGGALETKGHSDRWAGSLRTHGKQAKKEVLGKILPPPPDFSPSPPPALAGLSHR